MNGALIAVSITELELKAVELESKNGVTVVRDTLHVSAGEKGQSTDGIDISGHIRRFMENLKSETRSAVLVLSSEDLSFHDFSFPFNAPRKVQNAITFELSSVETEKDFVLDHVKSSNREPGYFNFIAARVDRGMLRRKTRSLENAGLRIVGITADVSTLGVYFQDEEDALVMETGRGHTLFVLYNQGLPVILRSIPIGFPHSNQKNGSNDYKNYLARLGGEIKRTIHSFSTKTGLYPKKIWVTGDIATGDRELESLSSGVNLEFSLRSPVEADIEIEIDGKPENDINLFGSLLKATRLTRKEDFFNFMKEEFKGSAPDTATMAFRWSAIIVALFLLAFILSSVLDLVILSKRDNFLSSEIRQTFVSAFPRVKNIEDELKQARNLLSAQQTGSSSIGNLNGSYDLLDVIHSISTRIPASTYFQIITLFWESGKVEIQGRTDSFKTVNIIQELLTANEDFAEVSISNARHREDSNEVEFKIAIRLGK